MRAVIQRVTQASVTVEGRTVGAIERGLAILVGVRTGDTEAEAQWMASKIATLRIFDDEEGKLNRSVQDVGGSILVVSQFGLQADEDEYPSSVRSVIQGQDWTFRFEWPELTPV